MITDYLRCIHDNLTAWGELHFRVKVVGLVIYVKQASTCSTQPCDRGTGGDLGLSFTSFHTSTGAVLCIFLVSIHVTYMSLLLNLHFSLVINTHVSYITTMNMPPFEVNFRV